MKLEYFKQQLSETKSEEAKVVARSNKLSTGRLAAALVALIGFLGGFMENQPLGFILGILGLLAFFYLLYAHQKAAANRAYLESKVMVLSRYISRFDSGWYDFADGGEAYLSDDFPQGNDLDVFGRASLYQFLCVAHTLEGKDQLAKLLRGQEPEREAILERQAAVAELAKMDELMVQFESLSSKKGPQRQGATRETIARFIAYGEDKKSSTLPSWLLGATYGLPVLTALALLGALFGWLSPGFFVAGVCIQWAFAMLGYGKVMVILEPLYSLRDNIQAYEQLFALIEQSAFTSPHLLKLQRQLARNGGATKGIGALCRIGEAANVRFNVVFYSIFSGLLMWNYQCVLALGKWKGTYGKGIRTWLEVVGQFEALMSLAVLCLVKEQYCFPQVEEGNTPKLDADGMVHPLLVEEKAVANGINLQGQTCVLTGSNMSGKTTFLRSIGVNLLLAYAGGAVCAEKMTVGRMAVFTSMRVNDDVSKGISTFYAEILRIKSMVQYGAKGLPMIVMIDEIFKGTNSADRIIGAEAVIKQLSKPWIIALVSTHDFELCQLAEDPQVRALNFHFEEYYLDDEIHFDYKMRPGKCRTTNAKHIMKMAGLMP